MKTDLSNGKAVLVNLAAAVVAVVFATGATAILIALIAAAKGYTVADIYAFAFPLTRGTPHPPKIPPAAYWIFAIYVIVAAEIALYCRRRIAARFRRG